MAKWYKLLSLAVVVVLSLTLAACDNKKGNEALEEAHSALLLSGDTDNITDNLFLPAQGKNQVTITWSSSNTAVIANDGKVTRPENGAGNAVVTLTATLTLDKDTMTKEFRVRVLEKPAAIGGTVAGVLAQKKDTAVVLEGVTVTGIVEDGYYVSDSTGSIFIFQTPTDEVKVGDKVNLMGNFTLYYDQPEVDQVSGYTVVSSDNTLPAAVETTIANIVAFDTKDRTVYAKLYTVEGTVLVEVDGSYTNVRLVDDAGNKIDVNYKSEQDAVKALEGKKVKVNIILHSYRSDITMWRVSFLNNEGDIEEIQLPPQQLIDNAKETIVFPTKVDGNLELPTNVEGVAISWSSDNTAVIANDGTVVLPTEITEVILTATFTSGDVTDTEEYTITVLTEVIPTKTLAEALATADGETVKVEATVVANSSYGYVVYDNGTFGFVFTGNIGTAIVGDRIVLITKLGSYNNLKQLQDPDLILTKSSKNNFVFADGALAELSDRTKTAANVKVTVSIVDGDVILTDANEDTVKVYFKSTDDYNKTKGAVLKQFEGKTITLPVVMYQDGLVLFLGSTKDITLHDATVADAVNAGDGVTVEVKDAIVVANSGYGYVVYGDGEFGFVYTNAVGTQKVGDKLSFVVKLGSYRGLKQLQNPSNLTIVSSDNELPTFAESSLVDLTSRELTGAIITVKVTVEGEFNNVYLTDGLGNKVQVYYKSTPEYQENEGAVLKAVKDKVVKLPVVMYQDGNVLFLGDAEDIVEATEQEQLDLAKTDLTVKTEVEGNITLPLSYLGVNVSWSSSDLDVIAVDGTVTRPLAGEADATVTLTATLTIGTLTETKTFDVTVNALESEPVQDLFFSEYIEGSSNNKALEIYNPTSAEVDLSKYTIELYTNGKTTVETKLVLSGTLAANDVYVIVNTGGSDELKALADLLHTVTSYNGDDVLLLKKDDVVIDSFGVLGTDPGTNWASEDKSIATSEMSLVRKPNVTQGDTVLDDAFDPSVEWIAHPTDTFSNLGSHIVDAQ